MRNPLPELLESNRLRDHQYGPGWRGYGVFDLPGPCGERLHIVSSSADHPQDTDSQGWEHVSVSSRRRIPNWLEMCFVKSLYWDDEEIVVQFHPPKSQWINNHPRCLHMFRHNSIVFPMPPSIMVGIKDAGEVTPAARTASLSET